MVLLCFLLDLRSLSPSLLRDLKQCLLQLANLYAVSSVRGERHSESLRDRIGLCYVRKCRMSSSDELKVAYAPRGNFSLRDFHHAVNNLPSDTFLADMNGSGDTCDVEWERFLSHEVLYSWGSKDIVRKVIFISCSIGSISPITRKTLMDAADKCVSVEFLLLEQELNLENDFSGKIKDFINGISDLENCSLQSCLPENLNKCADTWFFSSLVKQWLLELKGDLEEPLQAVFLFRNELVGSANQIFCNLFASVNQIIDGVSPCQTCRCHGFPLDIAVGNWINQTSCPVTCQDLGVHDLVENTVKVGEHTILFLPSFCSSPKLQLVSTPIAFNVIERTNLDALSEGVVLGTSYIVTPENHEMETTSDEYDKPELKPELNTQLFQGLCRALHSLDQGLVCSSNCNMETMKEATFHCFYILQPSDKGLMFLRRLAGSEEILPVHEKIQSINAPAPEEIEFCIQTSLSKMDLRDYNPLEHERGFHPKLNLLVKESLQFGSIPPKRKEFISEHDSSELEPLEVMSPISSTKAGYKVEEEQRKLTQATEAGNSPASMTVEWEQLFVNRVPTICSPTCLSKPMMKKSVVTPPDGNKPLDEKTSKILERLEVPRQLKTKLSPSVVISSVRTDACVPMKKPLVPFQPNHVTDYSSTSSQPIKPNFQRLKRKQR
ncbi:uncharacterized protein LOC122075390 isoform X2 [Macadamia integrifolia]|uniref:uncharacterized protein LOC122075390 isoform X2 n=1 Tax=Macadamia integrifolia TaxID=60698 RepID=UPI001C4F62F4|nr:uncharacterized protein LOC122075390 isoform X2 [Macadamia integrifolia]